MPRTVLVFFFFSLGVTLKYFLPEILDNTPPLTTRQGGEKAETARTCVEPVAIVEAPHSTEAPH